MYDFHHVTQHLIQILGTFLHFVELLLCFHNFLININNVLAPTSSFISAWKSLISSNRTRRLALVGVGLAIAAYILLILGCGCSVPGVNLLNNCSGHVFLCHWECLLYTLQKHFEWIGGKTTQTSATTTFSTSAPTILKLQQYNINTKPSTSFTITTTSTTIFIFTFIFFF